MATSVVDVAVQSLGKVKGNIASGMEDILNVVGNLAEGEDSLKDGENIDVLEQMMVDYAFMERTLEQFTSAVSEVKSQIKDSDLNVEDCKELLKTVLQEKGKDNSESDLQDHGKVQQFRNRLQELQEGQGEEEDEEAGSSSIADQSLGDEELVMTQTTVGTKCPFTQQEMTNPLRNKNCEHHYDRQGIDELFSKKKRFRCPLPGCTNKVFISMEDLEPDHAFKKVLEKQRRANKRKHDDREYFTLG